MKALLLGSVVACASLAVAGPSTQHRALAELAALDSSIKARSVAFALSLRGIPGSDGSTLVYEYLRLPDGSTVCTRQVPHPGSKHPLVVTDWTEGGTWASYQEGALSLYEAKHRVDHAINTSVPYNNRGTGEACFWFGRGLSRLSNKSLRFEADGVYLTGDYPNGPRFRAKLDPANQWLATRIETIKPDTGRVVAVMELRGPKIGPKGVRYMSAASQVSTIHPGHRVEVEYMWVSDEALSKGKPKWYVPGVKVFDHRVQPSVGHSFAELSRAFGESTPSLDQILELSKQKSAVMAKRLSDEKRDQRAPDGNTSQERLASAAVVMLAVCFFLYAGVRSKLIRLK